MKHLLIKAMAGSGLILMTLTASAQAQPQYDQNQERREVRDQDRIFDHLRGDLDRARASTMPMTPDRDRVIRADERVNECQRRVNSGTYDRRDFDTAIAAVQQVADMNRLPDEDRRLLSDDIQSLTRLRDRLGD